VTEAAPLILPAHVVEFCAMMNSRAADRDLRFYELADQYREWAAANPEAHKRVLPEIMEAKDSGFHAYKYEGVGYLIEGRQPTCQELMNRYDTWFFEATAAKLDEFMALCKKHVILVNKVVALEKQAAAHTDPKECAQLYQKAANLLAMMLKIKEPKI
jgi:hypothetical protein